MTIPSSVDLVAVDLSNIFSSSYHAANRKEHAGGKYESIGSFMRTLAKTLEKFRPHRLVIVLDGGKGHRHAIYPEYKGGRDEKPEGYVEQLEILKRLLATARLPTLGLLGYEADDILASLARRWRKKEQSCVIVSNDKDLCALVRKDLTWVYRPFPSPILADPAWVREKFGVPPWRLTDYLSLTGDSSDNIPGVPGIGPKGAVELIETYPTLNDIFLKATADGHKHARKLLDGQRAAVLSYALVKLVDTLFLETPQQKLKFDTHEWHQIERECEQHRIHSGWDRVRETLGEFIVHNDCGTT